MMMRKLRWLAVVVASFVLSACTYPQPSPDAGGIPAYTKSYYYETITALDPLKNPPEVQSRVAESVVEESRSHWFNVIEMEKYYPDTHIYAVQDLDFKKLELNKSYMFVIEPGQQRLNLCTAEECNKAVEKFKQFEK